MELEQRWLVKILDSVGISSKAILEPIILSAVLRFSVAVQGVVLSNCEIGRYFATNNKLPKL